MWCLGIDLSMSSKRVSTLALIDNEGNLTDLRTFREYDELMDVVKTCIPGIIAIDVPLGLPLGLDCLEESCVCRPTDNHKGRKGEIELARMGIGCFYTSKKSIVKGLIYRGVQFRNELVQQGFQVIEVYPYATKVMLFGDRIPSKRSPESLDYLREHLPGLVPGMESYVESLNHDRCDALLAAYTAYLHVEGKTDTLGIAEESIIFIPNLR